MGAKSKGTAGTSRIVEKDDNIEKVALEKASKRSKKKGGMKQTIMWYIVVGTGIVVTLGAIWLAATDSSGKRRPSGGGVSPLTSYVTERSFISGVNSDASGNFTAAASPFFNRWTYANVKWGLDGQVLRSAGFVGMAGALQPCEKIEDMEGGVLPPTYDTRTEWPTCAPEILDPGNCSSGYAIAAATSLASRFCVADSDKYGGLKLSPQQILSCDKKSGGCKGGGIDAVWGYIQRRGLYPEECVPFKGEKGAECKTTCEESKKKKVLDYCVLSGEKAIKREILSKGPIVAPVYLKDDYLVYSGGVYTPTVASKQQYGEDGEPIVVAVTVLGWGKSQNTGYWITSNSFGTSWGEKGFANIAFGTVVREDFAIIGTAATDEAIKANEKKKEEAAARKEEAKKERAARDARIKEREAQREAERRAQQDAAEDAEFEDDIELDLDDLENEEGGGGDSEEETEL